MANSATDISANEMQTRERRREAMAVLTRSTACEIAHYFARIEAVPEHTELRPPQSGIVMVRGRIGGDGAPFNFGEATVSRAAVRLASGETGFGYVLGRDQEKARLVALCDALLQSDIHRDSVDREMLTPIRAAQNAADELTARKTAATKVEFFTLVRGEG
ncbi:MAG: phosphonate C-P lyase system protein PhnG [Hyphomicrobiales bacterium]|nr:phosphonate C-P lyase system protein PhnG [Alphaproteobacteria bacterium]